MATSYALPLHCLSIGDTILVYWDGDRKWYPAEITEARSDHECEVLYKDGEREWVHLEKTKIIFRRDREGSNRRKRVKKEEEEEVVEEDFNGIEQIRYVLFDIGE